MSSDFNTEVKTYPNGTDYIEMRIGKTVIGTAVKTDDGYLAIGRRKPVKTLKEAGKQCLDRRMNACMKEHATWQKLLQRLLRDSD